MTLDRRDFLKSAGAIGALATGGCAPDPTTTPARTLGTGLARGLTLLSFREGNLDRLGAKTAKGILDVARAADLLRLYAPLVRRPDTIVCVGLNYRRHAEEVGTAIPAHPVHFNKFNASLNSHRGTVALPVDLATQCDYEVELVIVIERPAKRVAEAEAEALSYVAGYAAGNDVTARDLKNGRGGQCMVGKALDGFAPIGPYLVTADQVDPHNLTIECRVNGETRQSSSTSDFIFGARQMVSYISQCFTLEPGDLIFTGTPAGVIRGMAPDRRPWLKPGDTVACSVQGLGELALTLT